MEQLKGYRMIPNSPIFSLQPGKLKSKMCKNSPNGKRVGLLFYQRMATAAQTADRRISPFASSQSWPFPVASRGIQGLIERRQNLPQKLYERADTEKFGRRKNAEKCATADLAGY